MRWYSRGYLSAVVLADPCSSIYQVSFTFSTANWRRLLRYCPGRYESHVRGDNVVRRPIGDAEMRYIIREANYSIFEPRKEVYLAELGRTNPT